MQLAANALHHFCDVPIGAVEWLPELGAMPGDGREPPLDGAYPHGTFSRHTGREIEPDHLRVWGKRVEVLA
jgi:hypothetical protein